LQHIVGIGNFVEAVAHFLGMQRQKIDHFHSALCRRLKTLTGGVCKSLQTLVHAHARLVTEVFACG
jgi:hypothetical protein